MKLITLDKALPRILCLILTVFFYCLLLHRCLSVIFIVVVVVIVDDVEDDAYVNYYIIRGLPVSGNLFSCCSSVAYAMFSVANLATVDAGYNVVCIVLSM